jgi:hypothetical protein
MEVPYFRNFFSAKWEQPKYTLLGDNIFAVRVVLIILHHKPHLLPSSMSTRQLFNLATVCDKYDVTDIVVAYVQYYGWISAHWKNRKPYEDEWETWLWTLYVFHPTRTEWEGPRYEWVIDVLAANLTRQGDHWIIQRRNGFCRVSDIECPNQLAPLDSKYPKRFSKYLLISF